MPLSPRLVRHLWLASLFSACGLLLWSNFTRIARVEAINRLREPALVADPKSATGYAGGQRRLIAPEHNNESYQWIAQTQQLLATGEWRIRQVTYDNAPAGRAVMSPSLYRWWLALVAKLDAATSGRSPGLAVEHAALWADPILLLGFAVLGTLLVWRRFGEIAAAIFPLALAAVYPLAGNFVPGCPDDIGLGLVLAGGSLLTLLAGLTAPAAAPTKWFAASGIFGGLALWLNLSAFAPVIVGLTVGALVATWFTRRAALRWPWRAWGIAGAAVTILGWLIDYAPDRLDLRELKITQVHLVYGLAWLGLAELLTLFSERLQGAARSRARLVRLGLASAMVAAVPIIMKWKGTSGFLTERTYAFRLTALSQDSEAANLATWIVHQKSALPFLAVVLPLAALVPVFWGMWRGTDPRRRFALLLVSGPLAVVLFAACAQPSWWNLLDLLLLVALVVAVPPGAGLRVRWGRVGAAIVVLLVGCFALLPDRRTGDDLVLSRREMEGVLEREFSQWLARRAGPEGAIVLAPPNLTASLIFHGGLRGLGSPYRENEEGFRASVRLAGVGQADEAQAIARQRRLTHIVIPSWEDFLDEYARLGGSELERTLMGQLHQWLAPRWLRPVPYYLPAVKDFEDDRVIVYEMTEVQDHAAWLSRLTEYFLDMGQLELAGMATRTLASDYGGDFGGQITQARTAIATHDRAAFARVSTALLAGLKDGSAEALPWDRRVALSIVLAEGNHPDAAREQAQRCLEEMGELDLRGLSESTLFRFLGLCKSLTLSIEDKELRELSRTLLPPALRAQF